MILTYRYRIKDDRSRKHLERMAFACNQVWNYCGSVHEASRRFNRKAPTLAELGRLTSGSSQELGIHSTTVSSVVMAWCLSRSKHRKRPRWRKSFGPNRSLGWIPFSKSEAVKILGDAVRYKGAHFRLWVSRAIPDSIRSGSFSQDSAGRWYINLVCDAPVSAAANTCQLGIDLGLKDLAALSTGEKIANPRHVRLAGNRLAKAQRAGRKALARKIHRKVAAQRRHHLHVISARLARENSLIAVGDVNSAKLAKTRMAKSVLDAGWSAFRSMLRYKAIRHGAAYVEVNEQWTTQTCSDCGFRSGGPKGLKGLGVRTWECLECGSVHDRDTNAALNILRLGRSAVLQQTENSIAVGTKRSRDNDAHIN